MAEFRNRIGVACCSPFILALIYLCLLGSLASAGTTDGLPAAEERPNVLILLADDLGFSDLGCYGSEIDTPVLDGLAKNGIRYTQFYNTARCWPTRAALNTGYYAQSVRHDALLDQPWKGRQKFPPWAPLLSEILTAADYRCFHSGKWHMDGKPTQKGFARSYSALDQSRFFTPRNHTLDDQPLPAIKPEDDFYMTSAIADRAIEFLEDHQTNFANQPFFGYVAFTSPHFPLHALQSDISKYQGRYDSGWDQIRMARYASQRELGFELGGIADLESEIGPPYRFNNLQPFGDAEVYQELPWNELTNAQKEFQAAKMEIHAAMVDRMDQEIGRLVRWLERHDQLENTCLIFLSDNGASAEIMIRGDGHDPNAAMGSADTHLCLGPGWSTSSNTPFRRHKTWVHEGGITTPCIVHWPEGIPDPGRLCSRIGHVIDVVPTVLDLLDIESSTEVPRPGKSFATTFQSNGEAEDSVRQLAEGTRELWWLHEGNRAIRQGDFKAVADKESKWELYDLANDRSEQENLADQQSDKLDELSRRWSELHQEISEHVQRAK